MNQMAKRSLEKISEQMLTKANLDDGLIDICIVSAFAHV